MSETIDNIMYMFTRVDGLDVIIVSIILIFGLSVNQFNSYRKRMKPKSEDYKVYSMLSEIYPDIDFAEYCFNNITDDGYIDGWETRLNTLIDEGYLDDDYIDKEKSPCYRYFVTVKGVRYMRQLENKTRKERKKHGQTKIKRRCP